jgi:hypothetical protein
MKQSYVNLEVFNKRNGTIGIVVSQDETTISIKSGDAIKAVTESSFLRWYTIVPQDKPAEKETSKEPEMVSMPGTQDQDWGERASGKKDKPEKKESEEDENKKVLPAGAPGIGDQLRDKFLSLVKQQANQHLDITYDEKNHRDIVKYNGRNVFECTTAKRRFNVLCHPKSLTADNFKRANKVFPKEWGWSLSAKFVFTDINQWPLMKTIIVDGLFYRQREENKDDEQ